MTTANITDPKEIPLSFIQSVNAEDYDTAEIYVQMIWYLMEY